MPFKTMSLAKMAAKETIIILYSVKGVFNPFIPGSDFTGFTDTGLACQCCLLQRDSLGIIIVNGICKSKFVIHSGHKCRHVIFLQKNSFHQIFEVYTPNMHTILQFHIFSNTD